MLAELRIRDLAVIRDVSLELAGGLNVLTGETGAGKSIIVGALSLLLGERASSETVRAGAERAVVEAVFDLEGRPGLRGRIAEELDAAGLPDEGDRILLRREVQAEGRNRAWINGSPTTAGNVGAFGRLLVELHGQHDHQTLLDREEQRRIVDAFGGCQADALEVQEAYEALAALRSRREALAHRKRELEAQADFLRFQVGEIEGAELSQGEDAKVEAELSRLEHAEELAGGAESIHQALYAGEGSVSEVVARARDRARKLARLDPDLEPQAELLDSLYHQVVEAARDLGGYADGVEVSPGRTETLRKRADLLFRLKRKYGPELADVIATGARLRADLEEYDNASFSAEALDDEIDRAIGRLRGHAEALGERRREAAARLEEEVVALLPDLGMPGAIFRVEFISLDEPGPGGGERVEFVATLNPGFEPRPLSRIASGGELSRVMLALKAILARVDRVPTLIFDEVDAGIGGQVAAGVGEKLAEVAGHHQVFVITHLPQVAAWGDRHLRVEKGESEGLASSNVVRLEGDERVREIARMLDGEPGSDTSRKHARELLGRHSG
jgi:DNA repair protein RecN (Recombination protein N)